MRTIAIVELHGASHETPFGPYSTLHFEMNLAHFKREITSDEGRGYHLTPSVYASDHYGDVHTARPVAMGAANATGLLSSVIVIEAGTVAWNNLEPTRPSTPFFDAIAGLGIPRLGRP